MAEWQYRARTELHQVPGRWDWLARWFGLRHYDLEETFIVEADDGTGWRVIAFRATRVRP